MYRNAVEPKLRFTVGTEQIGLTYYLSRDKLESLVLELHESGRSEHSTSTSARADELTANYYRLERSYLAWLQRIHIVWLGRLDSMPIFAEGFKARFRPSRPFADRIHDLTFRLEPRESLRIQVTNRLVDHFTQEKLTEGLVQWLAISAAAFVYGGLHLLSWNAPFHAPIYGLLWNFQALQPQALVPFVCWVPSLRPQTFLSIGRYNISGRLL